MTDPQDPPFCSERCRTIPLNRSVRACASCGLSWNGQGGDANRHYCNSAWTICIDCARRRQRCVACAKPVPDAAVDA